MLHRTLSSRHCWFRKLPVFEIHDGKVVDTGKTQDPPLTTIPVSITQVRIGDTIILDPTAEEEACMNARITITTNSEYFRLLQFKRASPEDLR